MRRETEMARHARTVVRQADILLRERIEGRWQACVRCPRCSRLISVEWSDEENRSTDVLPRSRSLGRCNGCFESASASDDEASATGTARYVHVVLEPNGELTCGPWQGDAKTRLDVLVTGVASCGCCHVTLVRCGGCGLPIATCHRAPESLVTDELCGYCQGCDRTIEIKAEDVAHDGVLRFSDRVASPSQIERARRLEWRDRTRDEMHDVDGWTTMRRDIPEELLALIDLPSEAVEYLGRDGRLTWDDWLGELGGSEAEEHEPGGGLD